ncbi:MAG: hypothetical protein OEY99_03590 [Aigarchaeota archaeon]|nr:hypothetical protein [Aigarchaeota archaeon]
MNQKKKDDSYSVLGNMGRRLSVVGAFIGETRSQGDNLVRDNVEALQNMPRPTVRQEEKMDFQRRWKPKKMRKSFYETNDRIQKSVWINKPLRQEVVGIIDELNGKSLPFTEGQLLRESVETGWPTVREKYLEMLLRLGDLKTND